MKTWRDIDGLTPDADIETYQSLAERVPNGSVIVEVGCYHGKSLASLAEIIKRKNLRPMAVDLWDGGIKSFKPEFEGFFKDMLDRFKTNMKSVELDPDIFSGTSEEAVKAFSKNLTIIKPEPFMVYIDADHSYEWCKKDILAWWPLIPPGGILAGHDYGNENIGVKQAVDEFVASEKLELNRNNGCVWWVVKP
jgi:cephalosporin hydroxylase